jgi:hypothetical protein
MLAPGVVLEYGAGVKGGCLLDETFEPELSGCNSQRHNTVCLEYKVILGENLPSILFVLTTCIIFELGPQRLKDVCVLACFFEPFAMCNQLVIELRDHPCNTTPTLRGTSEWTCLTRCKAVKHVTTQQSREGKPLLRLKRLGSESEVLPLLAGWTHPLWMDAIHSANFEAAPR